MMVPVQQHAHNRPAENIQLSVSYILLGGSQTRCHLAAALHAGHLREEAEQQDAVDNAYSHKDEIGDMAFDDTELLQQRGYPKADNPGIKTHANPPKRVRSQMLNQTYTD